MRRFSESARIVQMPDALPRASPSDQTGLSLFDVCMYMSLKQHMSFFSLCEELLSQLFMSVDCLKHLLLCFQKREGENEVVLLSSDAR